MDYDRDGKVSPFGRPDGGVIHRPGDVPGLDEHPGQVVGGEVGHGQHYPAGQATRDLRVHPGEDAVHQDRHVLGQLLLPHRCQGFGRHGGVPLVQVVTGTGRMATIRPVPAVKAPCGVCLRHTQAVNDVKNMRENARTKSVFDLETSRYVGDLVAGRPARP